MVSMRNFRKFSYLFLILFPLLFFNTSVVHVYSQCLNHQKSLLLMMKREIKLDPDFDPKLTDSYGYLNCQSSSSKLATWNPNSDCCSWKGVVCEYGRVVHLDLSCEGISEGIDDSSSLFSLQYLKKLNLASNVFKSTNIPSRFEELINLESLNISNAGFSGQIPTGISRLQNLVSLAISSNYFSLSNPVLVLENPNLKALVRNLSYLKELHLDGVQLSPWSDNWGLDLSASTLHLRVLSLSGCHLNGPIDSSLVKLQSLSEIRLHQNNLSTTVPEFFATFIYLTTLDLSHANLHGIFPEKIFQMQTLQVIDLSGNEMLQGSLPKFPGNSCLQTLALSDTNFSGVLPNSIGNLKFLSRLEISGCRISGRLPQSVSNLTKLTEIDFSSHSFVGSVPSFSLLKDLTQLDLSDNLLTGSILSTQWQGLSKLEQLSLKNNSLQGSIPSSVFAIPSLQKIYLQYNQFSDIYGEPNISSSSVSEIDLSYNNLSGPFPKFIFKLPHLTGLTLGSNNLSGWLPRSPFKSENLEWLTISFNKFDGPFPSFILSSPNLTILDISSNNLSGPIPIFNFQFKKLMYLSLSSNSFSGLSIDANVLNVFASSFPELRYLMLSSCKLRKFPDFLRNSSMNIIQLDLSNNRISGKIPNWIWKDLLYLNISHNFLEHLEMPLFHIPTIGSLDLHSNRLQGEIPFFPRYASYLDYSMNNFSSSIPNSIPGSSLYFLSLSDNNLSGRIPESICNASEIQVLNLSNNSLSGPIPQCASALNDSLRVLNLGMNSFNGTISDALFQAGCQLVTLDLNGNRLSGRVPKSLVNCKELQVLNLGNNKIGGTFPCWLKEISSLSVLVLRSNKFHGELGCPETNGTWPILQIVDLSSNSFSGKLFAEWFLSWKGMMVAKEFNSFLHVEIRGSYYQDMVTVRLKGNEVQLEKILTIFASIDLSSNNFDGIIPQVLGDLKALHGLNLSRNNFRGHIPTSLGSLKQLESLDLSRNKLSGSIPQQLADLNFLSVLNLSFNQLEGRVPRGTQFDNLCEDSFLGNKGLVGPQVKRKCGDGGEIVASPPTSPLHDNKTRPKKSEVRRELIGAEVGFTVGLGIVIGSLVFWQRWREWYFDRVDQVLLRVLCHQNQRRPNQLRRRSGS